MEEKMDFYSNEDSLEKNETIQQMNYNANDGEAIDSSTNINFSTIWNPEDIVLSTSPTNLLNTELGHSNLIQDMFDNDVKTPEDMAVGEETEGLELDRVEISYELCEKGCSLEDYSSALNESPVDRDLIVANVDVGPSSSTRMSASKIQIDLEEVTCVLRNPYTDEEIPCAIESISKNKIVLLDPRAQDIDINSQMESKADFQRMNKVLKSDPIKREQFKEKKEKIVGETHAKFTTNFLSSIISKDLKKLFSWNGNQGRKGKLGFKHYEPCKIYFEIVDNHAEYKKLNKNDKEKPIKNWFRNANPKSKAPSNSNKKQTATKRPSKNINKSKTVKRVKKQQKASSATADKKVYRATN